MKRLLLIDDEFMARQHIKEALPWEDWGFKIVGEATNGMEALKLTEALAPDIALIDITMPVMDGLTLLKHMNSQFPNTKCVILTAHREFSYAKQALENGALGYILKSPINLAETKAALEKALWESEKDSKVLSASQNQMTIQSNRYPLRQHFFQQLLTGLYDEDHEIIKQGQAIGAQLEASWHILLVGQVDHIDGFYARYSISDRSLIEYSMLEIIRESLLELLPVQVELFPLQFGKVALLLSIHDRQLDREACIEICFHLEQSIQPTLLKYLDLTMKLAASEPFSQPMQIRSKYKQTDGLLIHRFYQEKPKTIFTYGLQAISPLSSEQWNGLNEMLAPLHDEASSESSLKCIGKIQSYLLQFKPSPSDVIRWFQTLEPRLKHAAHLPEWPKFEAAASLYEATNLLHDWLQKRDRIVAASFIVRPEIARAIQYILQHLGDELTLEVISAESGLSSSHFSHLFKKEIGKSVIDYVLEQRIELAKEYLSEGKFRNNELAEKVGFQHYSYFSNTFKKITGMSPNEYRRSVKPIITKQEK